MNATIENFKTIANIPHCSFDTQKLRDFLLDFCNKNNFQTNIDKFGNIHAIKGEPKICLQSHYDMVCMGDAPNIELIIKDGWLMAKNSTLGADNGIGVAMMMQMMREFDDLECLFTNDEEVGLIGANGFKGEIKSSYLLNLDSENDSEVIVGCAGGVSIFASILSQKSSQELSCYDLELSGLEGGHSGIDIQKNIPNAIKIMASFLAKNQAEIISINGGERSNSIPTSIRVKAAFKQVPKSSDKIKITKSKEKGYPLIYSNNILNLINSFAQGIRSFDAKLNMPLNSINLSTIKQDKDKIELEFFARSMSKDGLDMLEFETKTLANALGFKTKIKDKSYPWQPEPNLFSHKVLEILKKHNPNAKITAIHAGLECGILKQGQKNLKEVCSIGANILNPHSIKERCQIKSVELIEKALKDIIREF